MKPWFIRLVVLTAFAISIIGITSCEEPTGAPTIGYFRVMWNEEASTTATVGWSSTEDLSTHKIYYDEVDYGGQVDQYKYSQSPNAITTKFNIPTAFARLKDLKPNTKYYFVIASSKSVSARYWFETASDSPADRLAIIAGGDSRNNRLPRQNANLLVAKLRPHAVMFGGDMVESGSQNLWMGWFEDWQKTIAADGRITPLIIAEGNHENDTTIMVAFFDTATNVYYGVNFNDLLRVYTLNSEISIGGDQTNWLKSDLAANTGKIWKFAHYHKPMRPHHKSKGEGDNQYKYWSGPFYQYGMNIVVESDSHVVKSTWPLRPSKESGNVEGFVRDDQKGTVFLGEGCWGAPLRSADDNKAWTRDSGSFNHFNWLFIDRDKVEVRTVKVDNAPDVGTLTDESRFEIPANLDIWSPNNGKVITVTK
jgi:acid phosphatase type 7